LESAIEDQAVNSTGNKPNIEEVRYAEVRGHGCRGVIPVRSLKKVSPIPSLSGQHANEIMSLVIAKYVRSTHQMILKCVVFIINILEQVLLSVDYID